MSEKVGRRATFVFVLCSVIWVAISILSFFRRIDAKFRRLEAGQNNRELVKRDSPTAGSDDSVLGRVSVSSAALEELQVLEREVLRSRSVEVFPSAYVTALSIVLGIALGTAATSVVAATSSDDFELLAVVARAATVLVAVVVIFYNYVWLLVIFRWALGAFDSIIPMVLGSSVIAVAAAVPFPAAWNWCVSAMYFIGAGSFAHTIWRSRPEMFEAQADYEIASRLLKLLTILTSAGAASGLICALLAPDIHADLILGAATALCAVTIILVSERSLSRIYMQNRLNPRPSLRLSSVFKRTP